MGDEIISVLSKADDSNSRRAAIEAFLSYLDTTATTVPPKSVLKTLASCLCDPNNLALPSVSALALIVSKWRSFSNRFTEEIMCVVVLTMFSCTHHNEPKAAEIARQLPLKILGYPHLVRLFDMWRVHGMHWYPSLCEMGQFLLEQQLDSWTTQQLHKKPEFLLRAVVYLIVCFGEHSVPDLQRILGPDVNSVMIKALATTKQPLGKAAILQCYNLTELHNISSPMFPSALQLATSDDMLLCSQALNYATESIHKASQIEFEKANLDMKMLMKVLRRPELNSMQLIIQLLEKSSKYAVKLIDAGVIEVLKERTSVSSMEVDYTLCIYVKLSETAEGKLALKKASIASILWKYLDVPNHAVDLVRATKLLLDLGENVDKYIDNTFITSANSLGIMWLEMMTHMPVSFVAKFLKTSSDVEPLFAPFSRFRGIDFVTHFLTAFMHSLPIRTSARSQLELLTHHPMLMNYVNYLFGDHQESGVDSCKKKMCGALLAIVSEKVRSRVLDGGYLKHFVHMIDHNDGTQVAIQALSLIAFCNPTKFIQQGCATIFMNLLKRKNYHQSLHVLWALIASDPVYTLQHISGLEKALPKVPPGSEHFFMCSINDMIEAVKLSNFDVPTIPSATVNERVLDACSKLLQEISKNPSGYQGYYDHLHTYFTYISQLSFERFPENKNVLDFIWICLTSSIQHHYNDTVHFSKVVISELTEHWGLFDKESPHLRTRALTRACTAFLQQKDFISIGSEVFEWVNGNSENDSQFAKLKARAQEHRKQTKAHEDEVSMEVATVKGEIVIYSTTNAGRRKLAKKLRQEMAKLEKLYETFVQSELQNEELLQLAQGRVKGLEEQLGLPPTPQMLVQFAKQSSVDPIDLLNLEHIDSLEGLSNLKNKLKTNMKARSAAIARENIAHHERVMMCPICMDKPKNTAFAPCGHAMCATCSDTILSSNSNRCPICRVDVSLKLPLFF